MSFSGTQQKCKACDKTVHFIDQVFADGVAFHKTCFKCSHCNGKLVMGRYSSMDGVLYCKPHFEQLFKESGTFAKKLQSNGKPNEQLTRAPSKLSAMFSGTQDKCSVCTKTVYPLEKVTLEGDFYHKNCFRCNKGGCSLSPSNCAALDGILYCKPHFSQLFKEKGSYNYLTKTASIRKNAVLLPEQNDKTVAEKPKPEAGETEPATQESQGQ